MTAFRACDWRERRSNTLLGFCKLTLPSGMVLHDVAVHERNGTRWVAPPGRPQLDKDGQIRKDPTTGRILYTATVEFADRVSRDRFQTQALAAIDQLLGGAP